MAAETVGIVACSNPWKETERGKIRELVRFLENSGCKVLVSPCIYENKKNFSVTGKQRAEELMKLFLNPEVSEIYDISGGDMANEILDYLDFKAIRNSRAVFFGYSDLTTVLNAIYEKTGKSGVLYQMKNLVQPDVKELQRKRYLNREELFHASFRMIQGTCLKGTVVGGNIRCLLKLAGTEYFPDMQGKILLLEAMSGEVPQMVCYLSQLKSMGVFEKLNGILLGTFSEMQEKACRPDIVTLVQDFAGKEIPVAKTEEIGHHHNAKAIWIGKEL